MKRYVLFLLLLICTVGLPTAAQDAVCGDGLLPPRLVVGEMGQVTFSDGRAVNVRLTPGTSGELVTQLPEGNTFEVLEGPVCADGINWWLIRQRDTTGWVAEGTDGEYFVEPFTEGSTSGAPVATAFVAEGLPTVTPSMNPVSLENAFVTWDWAAFSEPSFYDSPDPLAVTLPPTYQGDLPSGPYDLSQVRFVDDANLNEAQRALLAQNGFVVVPAGMLQFEEAYQALGREEWNPEEGYAYWVTTDALLHALHIAFDNLLFHLEREVLYTRAANTVAEGYAAAFEQYQAAVGTPLEAFAYNAAVYYAVPYALFYPNVYESAVDPAIRSAADPIIAAIMTGEGQSEVSIFPGYVEDFSQYRARGHYAGDELLERYFRAMMWLGRITFRTNVDSEFYTSLLILRALHTYETTYPYWLEVHDVLGFLIGPEDNLGPLEYWDVAQQIFGAGVPLEAISSENIVAFRTAVEGLPGPRIYNVIRPQSTTAEGLDDTTRGFRLFGQRFTFDGYVMQQLIYPEVGVAGQERMLPSALDVAAAMGSDVAYNILNQSGATQFANYNENLSAVRQEASQITGEDWMQNIYGGWLWTLQPLINRDAAQYPALMNTEAWARRDLYCMLGSYTELKHDTLLYTAQPMGGLGGGGDRTLTSYSYIEPNPLVFSRIAVVAGSVVQGLQSRGIDGLIPMNDALEGEMGLRITVDAFRELAYLSAYIAEIARKEMWGEQVTDEEYLWIKYNFGQALWYIRYLAELPLADPPDSAALVADIASNPDAGTVLQVGTGGVDYIYVVTDSPEGLQLTRGTVYSFYEFTNDINARLNDDEWRATVVEGNVPPRPSWIDVFFAP